ncbi:MAG: hypothetical protein H6765_03495 [Candidatus Peribacteria bacterium]|nr:MAG: hypothetical protein H6765_03495 [Candidatus Peribacteria bacterium]
MDPYQPGHRQLEVSLGNETMYNGTNIYDISVQFPDGETLLRRIELQVDYERIDL